jgi:hypothetical protein
LVSGLDHGKRTGDTAPALGDSTLLPVTVLRLPDAPRYLSANVFHGRGIQSLDLMQVKARLVIPS